MTSDGRPDAPRYLLNVDGLPFEDLHINAELLEALGYPDREVYRDDNARHIAMTEARKVLIVAGPGTGKTTLFMSRIEYWLGVHSERIYVATFVRKLVRDLEGDLDRLPKASRDAVDASTLHTLARSLVERGHGTVAYPMDDFVRVIDQFWADIVWDDVLGFHAGSALVDTSTEQLAAQMHADVLSDVGDWPAVTATYRSLCQFYNAAGFAYFIVFAREVIQERPQLVAHKLWIIDEYQDFNPAEDHLIASLTENALGLLLAGDDEQALYQTLKASSPEIIIGHYADDSFAKAMLPYCSRCGFYICQAASAFIAKHRAPKGIDKIYLPLYAPEHAESVKVVGAPTAASAVDYVRKFLEDRAAGYEEYLARRGDGLESDPFLLVLSASGALTLSKTSTQDTELRELVDSYGIDGSARSAAYLRVATYVAAALHPEDNFAVRKVLHYEDMVIDRVHLLIERAMRERRRLAHVVEQDYPEIASRLVEVRALIDEAERSPDAAADGLRRLLGLADASGLARELEQFPLGTYSREQEDVEAIETAGELSPVALMTMNGAKGLSAQHVIIVGCDDMNMRYATPLTFFVALTRARRSLHIIASRKTGGSKTPHAFVDDLPAEACQFVVYRKTTRAEEQVGDLAGLTKAFQSWAAGEKFGRDKAAERRAR